MLQYLDNIIPEVHYHISALLDEIIDLKNELEFGAFLGLIQHHGFPTPLLDWTLSPYIAAYFAFREVNDDFPESEYVKIYLFDYIEWSRSFQQLYNLRDISTKYVSIIRPFAKFKNPRIIPQQGVFTVTNIEDMESYIESRSTEVSKRFLITRRISVKEKPVVLRELYLMGINEMSLFPSVGGICRAFKLGFFSPDIIGMTMKELLEQFHKHTK